MDKLILGSSAMHESPGKRLQSIEEGQPRVQKEARSSKRGSLNGPRNKSPHAGDPLGIQRLANRSKRDFALPARATASAASPERAAAKVNENVEKSAARLDDVEEKLSTLRRDNEAKLRRDLAEVREPHSSHASTDTYFPEASQQVPSSDQSNSTYGQKDPSSVRAQSPKPKARTGVTSPKRFSREALLGKSVLQDEDKGSLGFGRRGSQRILGSQTLVELTTTVKIGGRPTALPMPREIVSLVSEASQNPEKARKMQAAPSEELVLEYAYGFNGSCWGNLHAIDRTSCVYNVGSIGVVFDFKKNKQRFFMGHSDEITALGFCPSTCCVATGQRCGSSAEPWICLWRADEPCPRERQRFVGHQRGIYSLAFSADGRWLFSGDAEKTDLPTPLPTKDVKDSKSGQRKQSAPHLGCSSPVFVWRVSEAVHQRPSINNQRVTSANPVDGERSAAKTRIINGPQLQLDWLVGSSHRIVAHPKDPKRALAFSSRGATFLQTRGDWDSREGVETDQLEGLESSDKTVLHCAAWVPGDAERVVLGGTGVIYVVENRICVWNITAGSGMAIRFTEVMKNGMLACGGQDGYIYFLKQNLTGLAREQVLVVDHRGEPLNMTTAEHFVLKHGSDAILVGTVNGKIAKVRFDDSDESVRQVFIAQQSPAGGHEVSALITSPMDGSHVAIADRAGWVRFFDASRCELVQMSPYLCNSEVSCLAWGPKGRLLVAGQIDGQLEGIHLVPWAELSREKLPRREFLVPATEHVPRLDGANTRERTAISAVRFSPGGGNYLAVGCSVTGHVLVFRVHRKPLNSTGTEVKYHLEKMRELTGNATAVLFLQFSNDEKHLASNARDGQVLCWEVKTGTRITPSFPPPLWFGGKGERFQLTMSWAMIGIWHQANHTTTALVAEADDSGQFLAVGDDFGGVKLYQFPVPLDASNYKSYHCHSSKVTDLAWTSGGRMITVGASNRDGLLQWRLSTEHEFDAAESSSGYDTEPESQRENRNLKYRQRPDKKRMAAAKAKSNVMRKASPETAVRKTSPETAVKKPRKDVTPPPTQKKKVGVEKDHKGGTGKPEGDKAQVPRLGMSQSERSLSSYNLPEERERQQPATKLLEDLTEEELLAELQRRRHITASVQPSTAYCQANETDFEEQGSTPLESGGEGSPSPQPSLVLQDPPPMPVSPPVPGPEVRTALQQVSHPFSTSQAERGFLMLNGSDPPVFEEKADVLGCEVPNADMVAQRDHLEMELQMLNNRVEPGAARARRGNQRQLSHPSRGLAQPKRSFLKTWLSERDKQQIKDQAGAAREPIESQDFNGRHNAFSKVTVEPPGNNEIAVGGGDSGASASKNGTARKSSPKTQVPTLQMSRCKSDFVQAKRGISPPRNAAPMVNQAWVPQVRSVGKHELQASQGSAPSMQPFVAARQTSPAQRQASSPQPPVCSMLFHSTVPSRTTVPSPPPAARSPLAQPSVPSQPATLHCRQSVEVAMAGCIPRPKRQTKSPHRTSSPTRRASSPARTSSPALVSIPSDDVLGASMESCKLRQSLSPPRASSPTRRVSSPERMSSPPRAFISSDSMLRASCKTRRMASPTRTSSPTGRVSSPTPTGTFSPPRGSSPVRASSPVYPQNKFAWRTSAPVALLRECSPPRNVDVKVWPAKAVGSTHSPPCPTPLVPTQPVASFGGSPGTQGISRQVSQATGEINYAARICSTADGSELATAAMYLYHPPINIGTVVSYRAEGGECPVELFEVPNGWGVLRSRCGLLVWLKLNAQPPGMTPDVRSSSYRAGTPPKYRHGASSHGDVLGTCVGYGDVRLELQATTIGISSPFDIGVKAVIAGVVVGRTQLQGDEGLLRPASGPLAEPHGNGFAQIRLELESDFGSIVKLWLSHVHMHARCASAPALDRRTK